MLRIRAIQELLIGDVAGIETTSDDLPGALARLERARRRAMAVIAIDWTAIGVLVMTRAGRGAILSPGPTEEGIFAFGLLAIAIHSGFRLGQLEKLRAVERTVRELDSRSAGKDG